MSTHAYNNIGISALSIAFTLENLNTITISKALLIMPIISQKELVNYLGNTNSNVKSIEKLVVDKIRYFTNFNNNFYANLELSLNSIQLLHDLEVITIKNSNIHLISPIYYEKSMGIRAGKIRKAAKNIALLMEQNVERLYLNLRIEL